MLKLTDKNTVQIFTLSLWERSISWVTVALGSALISRMCFSKICENPPKSGVANMGIDDDDDGTSNMGRNIFEGLKLRCRLAPSSSSLLLCRSLLCLRSDSAVLSRWQSWFGAFESFFSSLKLVNMACGES